MGPELSSKINTTRSAISGASKVSMTVASAMSMNRLSAAASPLGFRCGKHFVAKVDIPFE